MFKQKQKKSKFLAFMLAFIMALINIPIGLSEASGFKDVNGHWAKDSIGSLISKGVVSGYPDYTFRPDGKVTRGEYVTMLNKVFSLSRTGDISFSDVDSSLWCYDAIKVAVGEGYTSGYPDNTFRPNSTVTRAEAAVFTAKILNADISSTSTRFIDDIPDWARGAVAFAASKGYLSGYPDGTFNPEKPITRAESAVIFNNILNSYKKEVPKSEIKKEVPKPEIKKEDNDISRNKSDRPDRSREHHGGSSGGSSNTQKVDKASLKSAIERAKSIKIDKVANSPDEVDLGINFVTPQMQEDLENALNNAEKVYEDDKATKTDVDNALDALNRAIDNYRVMAGTHTTDPTPQVESAVVKDDKKDTIVITMNKELKTPPAPQNPPPPPTEIQPNTGQDEYEAKNNLKIDIDRAEEIKGIVEQDPDLSAKLQTELKKLKDAIDEANQVYINISTPPELNDINKAITNIIDKINKFNLAVHNAKYSAPPAQDPFSISVTVNDKIVKTGTQANSYNGTIEDFKVSGKEITIKLTQEFEYYHVINITYDAATKVLEGVTDGMVKSFNRKVDNKIKFEYASIVEDNQISHDLAFIIKDAKKNNDTYTIKASKLGNSINFTARLVDPDPNNPDSSYQPKQQLTKNDFTLTKNGSDITFDVQAQGNQNREYTFTIDNTSNIVNSGDVIELKVRDDQSIHDGYNLNPVKIAFETSDVKLSGIKDTSSTDFSTNLNAEIGKFGNDIEYTFDIKISPALKSGDSLSESDILVQSPAANVPTVKSVTKSVSSDEIYTVTLKGIDESLNGKNLTISLKDVSGYNIATDAKATIKISSHSYNFQLAGDSNLTGNLDNYTANLKTMANYSFDIVLTSSLLGSDALTIDDVIIKKGSNVLTPTTQYTVTKKDAKTYTVTINTVEKGAYTISAKKPGYDFTKATDKTLTISQYTYKYILLDDNGNKVQLLEKGGYKAVRECKIKIKVTNYDADLAGADLKDAFKIDGIAGATATATSSGAGVYEVTVKGITNEGTATITIEKQGYSFSPDGNPPQIKIVKKTIDFKALPKEEMKDFTRGSNTWRIPKTQTDFDGADKLVTVKTQQMGGKVKLTVEFDEPIKDFIGTKLKATSSDPYTVSVVGDVTVQNLDGKYLGELTLQTFKETTTDPIDITFTSQDCNISQTPLKVNVKQKPIKYWIARPETDAFEDGAYNDEGRKVIEKGLSKASDYQFGRNTSEKSRYNRILFIMFQKDNDTILDNSVLGNIIVQKYNDQSGQYENYQVKENNILVDAVIKGIDNDTIESSMIFNSENVTVVKVDGKVLPLHFVEVIFPDDSALTPNETAKMRFKIKDNGSYKFEAAGNDSENYIKYEYKALTDGMGRIEYLN